MKTETIEVKLPATLIAELAEIAKLAGVKIETVMKVVLAIEARKSASANKPAGYPGGNQPREARSE